MAAEKLDQTTRSKRKTTAAANNGTEDESSPPRNKRLRTDDSQDDSFASDDVENTAGKITRIFMKNFMCHDAMEVNLNKRVNFVVGMNGSGKSAILTALTVGLGARANVTNRGSSNKEFIKNGKSSCSIEISITNDGPMAYKYEDYGNLITVVRNISHSTSSYKIKNWRGDQISTKRCELDNIINQLNIQVDNPISILNQDAARSFLQSTKSTDKYKLFMKATRLDVIGDNYRSAIEASEITKQNLEDAKKLLFDSENEVKTLRKKLKALESLDKTRVEYADLQKEVLWAAVREEEKKLLDLDTKMQDQQDSMEKLKNQETSKAAKEQEINSKIVELKQEIAQHEAEASGSDAKLREIKERFTEARKINDEKKENIRNIHTWIRRKEDEINTLQGHIRKLEEQRGNAEKQKLEEELATCEQNLEEVEATLRTKQTELVHLEENKRRIEQDHHNAGMDVEQKKIELNKLRNKLKAYQNQSSDALTVYGPNMPRLLRRIEEENQRGRFLRKPVGPLGHFIKMKDPKWIPAVENHLGFGTLTLFCVDNQKDNRVLSMIISEVFRGDRPPQVVISKFFDHMHDVRGGCTNSPRYPNLLEAMEISHPVIANSLIDQREVECILLIPTSDEACTIMSDEQKVPRNTKRAITMNADLFYPDPQYRTYGGSVSKPRFLQVSTSEAIQSLKEEIAVCEDELRLAQEQFQSMREKKQMSAQEYAKVQQQVKQFMQTQQNLKNRIEKIKDDLSQMGNDENINAFKAEIEVFEQQVAAKKEEEAVMIKDFNESKKNLNALNDECKKQRDLAQNLEAKLQPFKDQIKELKDEKNRLKVSNENANRRMEEARQVLQKLNGEHQQQQRVVNSKIEVATNACPRMETERSVEELSSRIKEIKTMIESMERQHGTKEALAAELAEKEEKFIGIRDFAVELQRSNDKQLDRLRKRKQFYNEMKKRLNVRIQESFSNVLALRSYKGKITINHHNRDLEMEVTPIDAKRTTTDAKSLSGGERSYSTIAFILALWDITNLPFYFLDEFDVFMDKINRRVVLDILLDYARKNRQSQFAFLTPLDTSHIIADNSVTIHRLAPPERS